MYAVSMTVEVNPPDAPIRLTHDQVWRGLVMKAEYSVPFVPGQIRCDIVERLPDGGFWREVQMGAHSLRERISFAAPVQVMFERPADSPNAGWITNVISEMDGALLLTFTIASRFRGTEEGSPEEAAAGLKMRDTYQMAISATLARVRELVMTDQLSAA